MSHIMNIASGPSLVVEDILTILELPEGTPCFRGYPVVPTWNGQGAREQVNQDPVRLQAEIQGEYDQVAPILDEPKHEVA